MPQYRMGSGVIVDISEEKAARLGLTPADAPPATPRRGRPPKLKTDE
ncbi:hypothetical protein 7S11_5 [uncultured Caudovirales phage]|uniref:Uncharacterized protein n=1 Tax=uncultured Caudovirales phage TaxID=2100421 RepID=A0A2H4J128_9CAUD|nr:hypothetical protein 7S11_5 [uncultured Caudovirales phage]